MKNKQTFEYLQQFLTDERLRKINHFAPESSDFVLPVIEDVFQFRNAAAIVRSVEACGFHKIVAMESAHEFNPNLRVTKGAETWVEVERLPQSIDSLKEIKNRGYKIVAVSPENNATLLPDFQITEPVALVFGTEAEGVSKEVLDFADETLAIPMYGFTRSFNVSVAAAICMYELKQKLIKSNLDYKLSEEKLWEMKVRWAVNSITSGQKILERFQKHLI
ncbi:RNA methyltransferase [Chryseobacterium sp. MDT2-18]|uniref:TrmH family RNA methyltransferase n=1 Tax=Chryseobacterium sp. MDT2-18 TaxID=1259136 RepID=UPI00278365B3|nr:RNA methyltransferase [Chryseobacterium sp. MDT2-18]MDQ0477755.1 tRNA (guanosine-2'-O-)-methyltransferase [Chryseobacterium sp. MDT2-18]